MLGEIPEVTRNGQLGAEGRDDTGGLLLVQISKRPVNGQDQQIKPLQNGIRQQIGTVAGVTHGVDPLAADLDQQSQGVGGQLTVVAGHGGDGEIPVGDPVPHRDKGELLGQPQDITLGFYVLGPDEAGLPVLHKSGDAVGIEVVVMAVGDQQDIEIQLRRLQDVGHEPLEPEMAVTAVGQVGVKSDEPPCGGLEDESCLAEEEDTRSVFGNTSGCNLTCKGFHG